MSTLLYESLTAQREVSQPGTSTAPSDAPDEGKPGLSKFVDSVAALVPVEVLAAHAIILGAVTTKTDPGDGTTVVTFIDEDWATEWARNFWYILFFAAVALYAVPHIKKRGWDRYDVGRMAIPAMAFAAWTIVQKPTLFDAVDEWSNLARAGAGVGLGLVALLLSRLFADEADEKTAPDAERLAMGLPARGGVAERSVVRR